MEVTRWIDCPRCGRPVRLTAAELEAKRGFCASCDARFELGPESRLGDGPGRELVHIPAALVVANPPSEHVVLRRASPLEVELHSRRSPVVSYVATGATFVCATFAFLVTLAGGAAAIAIWLLPAMLSMFAWHWWPRSDLVTVHPGRIDVSRRGILQARLDVDDDTDLAVGSNALVVTTAAHSLEVGHGLELHPAELRWLRDAVRAAARSLPAAPDERPPSEP